MVRYLTTCTACVCVCVWPPEAWRQRVHFLELTHTHKAYAKCIDVFVELTRTTNRARYFCRHSDDLEVNSQECVIFVKKKFGWRKWPDRFGGARFLLQTVNSLFRVTSKFSWFLFRITNYGLIPMELRLYGLSGKLHSFLGLVFFEMNAKTVGTVLL